MLKILNKNKKRNKLPRYLQIQTLNNDIANVSSFGDFQTKNLPIYGLIQNYF